MLRIYNYCLIIAVLGAIGKCEPVPLKVGAGIVNGVTVAPTARVRGEEIMPNTGKYPYLVFLYNNRGLCSGVLIKSNFALTAAHCTMVEKSLKIIAGIFELGFQLSPYMQEGRVDLNDIIRHPKFKQFPNGNINDIAILRLKFRFRLNKYVNTINLATQSYIDKKAVTLGWGSMVGPYTDTSKVLRQADMTIISNDECTTHFNGLPSRQIDDSMICAIDDARRQTTCRGDSGGPLIIPNAKGPKDDVLVGLMSWGTMTKSKDRTHEICNPQYPVIFARITQFRSWIIKTINPK